MTIEPTDAIVVVDVQNDFCPGGALAVSGGNEIVPVINGLLPLFEHRVFTRDWHPVNHCSFCDNPQWVDKSWPRHCVQDTPGADFHPQLEVPAGALIISKGVEADREAYSGFQGTDLADSLRREGVSRLFVCGLATDYCVKATALDGIREGFQVVLLRDASRGVNFPEGSVARAEDEMKGAGVVIAAVQDFFI